MHQSVGDKWYPTAPDLELEIDGSPDYQQQVSNMSVVLMASISLDMVTQSFMITLSSFDRIYRYLPMRREMGVGKC